MKRWLGIVGAFFLVAFLAAGVAAWLLLPDRLHVTVTTGESERAAREPPAVLAQDAALARQLEPLVRAIGELRDELARAATRAKTTDDPLAAIRAEFAELRHDLAAMQSALDRLARAPETPPVDAHHTESAPAAAEPPPASAEPIVIAPATSEPAPQAEPPPSNPPPPAPAAPPEPPPPPPRIVFRLVDGGSKVGFDGSSNLHDFTGATLAVTGSIDMRPDRVEDAPIAVVDVDARKLDTGNSSRDEDMHGAHLQSQKFPTLRFTLEGLEDVKPAGELTFHARARGTFLCHGREKKVAAAFKAERVGAAGLRVEGELELKMSDFGIPPPTALGGLVRTHDDVRVWFVLQARADPAGRAEK